MFLSLYNTLNSFLNKQARLFLMSAPPIVAFYHTSRLFNEVENACSVYLCRARIDWLLTLPFERKELCKTLKMKHANRPLRVCQVEICILDFEGSQCSVKSYANSHDGRMFFFSTQMLYAARNLNAPFPFSFTRIDWVILLFERKELCGTK